MCMYNEDWPDDVSVSSSLSGSIANDKFRFMYVYGYMYHRILYVDNYFNVNTFILLFFSI
jgi:hypothetical protein